jgi:hypothetical protein
VVAMKRKYNSWSGPQSRRSTTTNTGDNEQTVVAKYAEAEMKRTNEWVFNLVTTFGRLKMFVAGGDPVLELELRRPILETSEWNIMCGRVVVLHGIHSKNITGPEFAVHLDEVSQGWEYDMGEYRYRHWDNTAWNCVAQKKIKVSTMMCSSGCIYASMETNVVVDAYNQAYCESHVPRSRIARTTTVITHTSGCDAVEIRVVMTERSLLQSWLEIATSRDVEVELVLSGDHLNDLPSSMQSRSGVGWTVYMRCLLSVWRWFGDGVIGVTGMTASVPERQNQAEVLGPLPQETKSTLDTCLPVSTLVDGGVVLPVRVQDVDMKSGNRTALSGMQPDRAVVTGVPFTITYDGNNYTGRGSVSLRRGVDNSTVVTKLQAFLVDDNSTPTSTEIQSALVSSKRLRYSACSSPGSAFVVQGVIITGVYVVTGVYPSTMLAVVKRSWPRTFAVHFISTLPGEDRLSCGWREERVRWDVVRRIHTKKAHTLSVTTLVPMLVTATVSQDLQKVVLGDPDVPVRVRICVELTTPDEPALICLSARTISGDDVMIMVKIGSQISTHSVIGNAEFEKMITGSDVVVGYSWLVYNRTHCMFRNRNGTTHPFDSLFECLDTYEQFLWMCCELGCKRIHADAVIHSNGKCYINPGPSLPAQCLVEAASGPPPDVCEPGLYHVSLWTRSRLRDQAAYSDHHMRCTGSLHCVSVTAMQDNTDLSQMRPLRFL